MTIEEASKCDMTDAFESVVACQDSECAAKHRQIAEWLKDYKKLRQIDAQIKDAISRCEMQKLAQDEISGFEYEILKIYGVME